MIRRVGLWPLERVLTEWTSGEEWSWDDEAEDLNTHPCFCATTTDETGERGDLVLCPTPGHYQQRITDHMRETGGWFDAPALLGNDGRVWDGHHRLVAARELGIRLVLVEVA